MIMPIGTPVLGPAMPTSGDTKNAPTMPAKPRTAEALPASLPYLAMAMENPADPNTDTVHTVKNKIMEVTMNDQWNIMANRNRREPIVN